MTKKDKSGEAEEKEGMKEAEEAKEPKEKVKAEKKAKKGKKEKAAKSDVPEKRTHKVELKFLVDDKKEMHVLLEGFDVGLANLLVQKLLENKEVEFAATEFVHPTQRTPVLKVKAKVGVKKAVAEALKEVQKELKAMAL